MPATRAGAREDEMLDERWADFIDVAITVCDRDGLIVAMNERSKESFAEDGGGDLIGKSLFACHEPESAETIRRLIREGAANTYTIEKNGVHKLICQTPWYEDGAVAGLVELSIILPASLPHHVR
jgi:transcriptional regulator with PAS, ATPase and Fis domain